MCIISYICAREYIIAFFNENEKRRDRERERELRERANKKAVFIRVNTPVCHRKTSRATTLERRREKKFFFLEERNYSMPSNHSAY